MTNIYQSTANTVNTFSSLTRCKIQV